VAVCIGYRESMAGPLLPPPWFVEEDPRRADFVIETERSSCIASVTGTVVGKVERFQRTFATTLATRREAAGGATIGARR
jgi:hypothetical protein